MALYYSATTAGFFDDRIHDQFPHDAKQITGETYDALMAAQSAGKQIVADANGLPEAVTPTVTPPTLPQQAQAAIAAGLAITSTATPALDGTYAIDSAAQGHLQAEMISLLIGGVFADGTASVTWPDMAGVTHDFDVDQFKALALAAGKYVAALYKVINGSTQELPAATATIA